jgi:microcystin degradation protein MlrC
VRIFAAGIATETNTFTPTLTGQSDFLVQRGHDVLAGRVEYPGLDLSACWGKQAAARGDTFVFSLMAWAEPSGKTVDAAYEALRDEVLRDLRAAMPIDIVLLNLHGAMVAEHYDDCEQDFIERVRAIAGPAAVIAVEFDLHCHLSLAKIAAADVVVTYKEYPHVDVQERAREVFDLAIATKCGDIRPTKALFDCRMLGMYPTTAQPLRAFVDSMAEAERRPGILSISFGHGFQFADVPHVGAKVLVIADGDPALAQRMAHQLGSQVYGLRRSIGFDALSLSMEAALSRAMRSTKHPVVVADQSDNTGGGAPGDSTFALRWLLEHDARDAAIALIYDPEVVRLARKAGLGAVLPVRLGGKLGRHSGEPVDLEVSVSSMLDDYVHALPQPSGGPTLFAVADVVALRYGSIDLVVSSERCQCFAPSIFSDLGIEPSRKRILIVKSYQHFYRAFAAVAAEVIYMSAPGAVPPDPRHLCYQRVQTAQLYPWVDDPLGSDTRTVQ